MTAIMDDQDQAARAALVCHPDPSASSAAEFTYWADVAEAKQARTELTKPRCGPLCIGRHTVVRLHAQLEPRRRTSPRIQPRGGDPGPRPARPPLA